MEASLAAWPTIGSPPPGGNNTTEGTTQADPSGVEMTSAAFERNISWSPYALAVAGILFAFSTMIAWSYYGLKGWTYLVGEGRAADLGFKAVFCVFVALGCMIKLDAVLDFSDALVFVICVPNILGLYVLAPVVKQELQRYNSRLANGEFTNYRLENVAPPALEE